jgi:hypothetical protein
LISIEVYEMIFRFLEWRNLLVIYAIQFTYA